MLRRILGLALFVSFLPATALAQQGPPEAEKKGEGHWYRLTQVDFKAGQMDEAMDIVYNHFVKASEAAGTAAPHILEHETGEWDVTYVFPMERGPDGLNWELTPEGEKFLRALAEQEGGMERAEKLFEKYDKKVARAQSEIVFEKEMDEEDESG